MNGAIGINQWVLVQPNYPCDISQFDEYRSEFRDIFLVNGLTAIVFFHHVVDYHTCHRKR
jgi:hypothetical protein